MKINKPKKPQTRGKYLIIDPRGRIKGQNDPSIFGKEVESVSAYIDQNHISKLSMCGETVDIIKVNSKTETAAVLSVRGTGIGKEIKVSFIDTEFDESEFLAAQNMVAVTNYVNEQGIVETFELSSFAKQIVDKMKEETPSIFVNVFTRGGSFTCNATKIQLAVVSAIAMAHEISPTRPIDLYVNLSRSGLEIKVIVRTDTLKIGKSLQEVESIFPRASIRLSLLEATCETQGIEYELTAMNKSVTVRFVSKEEQITELRARPFFASALDAIIRAFKPNLQNNQL